SDAQEVELGITVDQQIRQQYKIALPDDPISEWAVQLVTPLEEGSVNFRDPSDIDGYKVAVIVDDALVNAFAAPGGFTYISTGLIIQSNNCGEIAGVMGHELGHVTERHGVKSIEVKYGAAVISEWFFGEGIANDVAQGLFGIVAQTQFSQEAESESDEVGLQVAFNAGYNPYGLVAFFAKLLELQGGPQPPSFLSSHPATQDRIEAVTASIEKRYGDAVNPEGTQTYACVGTALTLDQIKSRIANQQVTVDPSTGLGATDTDSAASAQPEEE
ncbi:MAG: putative Zn-dependent protease, partial [Myxococcota bacterium]